MSGGESGPLALGRHGASVHLDRGLVEQAVRLAIERVSPQERRRFHREREPIYELDPARREASFQDLHARWLDRLALADPLLALLAEQPSIERSTAACLVGPAARRKDEHADLRDPRALAAGAEGAAASAGRRFERPVLVIRLRAPTLADAGSLERLLRRELCYVADMLDPAFGYDPALAVRETSGPLASLLRERHELLWRVAVDGRLDARGLLGEAEAAWLRARFGAVFAMLPESGEATFRALFEGPRPSHRELMRLARSPSGESRGPSECPLCRMPAPSDRLQRQTLSARATVALRRDFAGWREEEGLCSHCADLYELRESVGAVAGRSAGGPLAAPAAARGTGDVRERRPRPER